MRDVTRLRPSDHGSFSTAVSVLFGLLNPIPFGFFVAALIFDAVYANTAVVMWGKSAAWLITIGLFVAIIPRLIDLAWVWFSSARLSTARDKLAFILYLLGIVAAIVNAFVHGRDAYAIIPEGLWLSILTVVLLIAANILMTLEHPTERQEVQA